MNTLLLVAVTIMNMNTLLLVAVTIMNTLLLAVMNTLLLAVRIMNKLLLAVILAVRFTHLLIVRQFVQHHLFVHHLVIGIVVV